MHPYGAVLHRPAAAHLASRDRNSIGSALAAGHLAGPGELSELRTADLRFVEEEVPEFLNGSLALSLSANDIRRLEERTEGWPAGLYLAVLALRDRGDAHASITEFAGHDRHIVDYLGWEVLGCLSPDLLVFLGPRPLYAKPRPEVEPLLQLREGAV